MAENFPHIAQIVLLVLIFVFIVGTVYFCKAIKTKTTIHIRIASVFIILFFLGMRSFALLHALIMKHCHPDISLLTNVIIVAICFVSLVDFKAVAMKGRFVAWKVNRK